ncbi:ABC transporter substrate-binding protein [Falsigemmobacter intermedius]|uniref:Extracellular solute-binding protein n=1 Tax=Falsigemmobacter intermedius TaxID=1553448 RepID=A0A444MB10_9RHOB|nr:ABC transporter substrate-binding protein [Falsigemmobacter intermedius]RWY40915.1 extracellular solute-binding protein [Falsigemmobacter intermedius]
MTRFALSLVLPLALPFAASAETLKLYTSQPNADAQKTVDAFQAAHPGITVDWVRDGTTQLMARMNAEKAAGAGQPDVLLIADSVTLEGLVKEGRIAAYKSPEAAAYDPALYSAEGYYHSTKLITTGIAYHTEAKQIPASWADLAKPEYKGLVAMASPLYSGAAMIHMTTLTSDAALGWPYYEALAANETRADGGNGGVFKAVASGEKPYGVLVDYMALRAKAEGSPIEFIIPEEGVTWVTEPVAIVEGTKNLEAAQKFVDFVISEAGQNLVAEMGYIPARNGIDSPAGFPARDSLKLLTFEAGAALEATETNKAKFSEIFGIK